MPGTKVLGYTRAMSSAPIRNVSDTARWVASYRAQESARKDALFKDPLAERFAADRGHAIADLASEHTKWALITRTKVIDDLVLRSVAQGADCVLNLAAGFDTRPYRLELPSELLWIEADLGPVIDEKQRVLSDESPRCKLMRRAVNVADPVARAALLHDVTVGSHHVLVITEGLLLYLETDVVAQLARSLAAEANMRDWIADFSSTEIVQMMERGMGTSLANAPFKFVPEGGVTFFEPHGWKAAQTKSLMHEAAKLRRLPLWMRPFAWLPQPKPNTATGRWSVVVQFERA
jgi:methyltransferase (TIGR00027 family)